MIEKNNLPFFETEEEAFAYAKKRYRRNPEKMDFFKDNWKIIQRKHYDFDAKFKEIKDKIVLKGFNFGKNKQYQNYTQQILPFIQEELFYVDSTASRILKRENEKNVEFVDIIHDEEVKSYNDRTESFRYKYGKAKFQYKSDFASEIFEGTEEEIKKQKSKRTINYYYSLYKNNKITRDDMNNIIKDFKDLSDKFYGDSGSAGRNIYFKGVK